MSLSKLTNILSGALMVTWPTYLWPGVGVEESRVWPSSTIKYVVCDDRAPVPESICSKSQYLKKPSVVLEAINSWNASAGSIVKLEPLEPGNTKEPYLLYAAQESRGAVSTDPEDTWCFTIPGYTGTNGPHPVIIGNTCTDEKGNALGRTVLHETGHAIGLFHEQQRMDRDKFLEVYFGGSTANTSISQSGRVCSRFNQSACQFQSILWPPFRIYRYGQDLSSYDPLSVMHYSLQSNFELCKADGSNDPQNTACMRLTSEGLTLVGQMGATANSVGRVRSLSDGDLRSLRELYPLPQ